MCTFQVCPSSMSNRSIICRSSQCSGRASHDPAISKSAQIKAYSVYQQRHVGKLTGETANASPTCGAARQQPGLIHMRYLRDWLCAVTRARPSPDPVRGVNLGCGMAAQGSLGEAEGPKPRRMQKGKGRPSVASRLPLGCVKGGKGKTASDAKGRFPIPRESVRHNPCHLNVTRRWMHRPYWFR
jgi:hypothetical protein